MEFDQNYSHTVKLQNSINYQYNGISGGLFHCPIRNRYYDEILKECKDKRCIDIGSGSGMLAFIALKHGAKHITCFEQNPKSAQHIRTVAERMNLSEKITVIRDEFRASKYDSYGLTDIDIIFHELIGSYIWNDSMTTTFDVPLPIRILPSNYDIQFNILQLKKNEYDYLINLEISPEMLKPFNLGIDLPSEFEEYYNDVIQSTSYLYHKPAHILDFAEYLFDTVGRFYRDRSDHIKVIHTHRFDINDKSHHETRKLIKFNLPQIENPYLIIIRPFFYCSSDLVYDFKVRQHFTGYYRPIIVPPVSRHKVYSYELNAQNTMKLDNIIVK